MERFQALSMSLLKRIKTLWRLSACEIGTAKEDLPVGTKVSMIVEKPKRMAQIIKRESSSEKFLRENKNE